MNIDQTNSTESYELDDLLRQTPPSPVNSFDSAKKKEKDRKGRLIVDTFLKHHHHSNRHVINAGANLSNLTNHTPAPAGAGAAAPSSTAKQHKKPKNAKKLDEYGFIVNIDDKGTIRSEDSFYVSGGASTPHLGYTHDPHDPHAPHASSNGQGSQKSQHRNNPGPSSGDGGPGSNGLTGEYARFQNLKFGRGYKKMRRGGRRGKNVKGLKGVNALNRANNTNNANDTNNTNNTKAGSGKLNGATSRQRKKDHSQGNHKKYNNRYQQAVKLQQKLNVRREKKWNQMISDYKHYDNSSSVSNKQRVHKLHSRVRKGIPNSVRGKAWVTMAKVDLQMKAMNGVYTDLVEQSCTDKFEGIHDALLPFVVEDGGATAVAPYHNDDDGYDGDRDRDHDHMQNVEGGPKNQYCDSPNPNNKTNNQSGTNGASASAANDPTVDIMKETIERDINRTFPRHSMFYDSYSDSDDEEDDENDEYYDSNNSNNDYPTEKKKSTGGKTSTSGGTGTGLYDDDEMSDESYDRVSLTGSLGSAANYSNDIATIIQDFDNLDASGTNFHQHHQQQVVEGDHCWTKSVNALKKATANCPTIPSFDTKKENALISMKSSPPIPPSPTPNRKEKKKVDFTTEGGGQAILRRVLRAYSLYDPEVGYCQGMNFIAGMFITFVTEEEAFWLLVYVMNAKPCRMRGLFGVGMSEAHQVLYVAEKLIGQFNPRLSKHFDKENIHITMFATQWLLTMFTSSFPFHIVTRVWDCFILEGWKVAYRVMLALLEIATPDLLKLRFEDILNYFKVLPFQVNVHVLFDATFNVPLKKKHIEKYAKEWLRKQETDKMKKKLKEGN